MRNKPISLLVTIILIVSAGVLSSGCQKRMQSARLDVYQIEKTQMGRPMQYAILQAPRPNAATGAPQGAHTSATASDDIPVFVLLHGMGGDHRSLDRYGVSDVLISAMEAGDMPRAHFIMPNGERGFFVDWFDGTRPYEQMIMSDVIPSALGALGLKPDHPLHIMGMSMGGQGALRIGLNYPHRFESIGVFSTMIFTQEEAAQMMQRPVVRLLLKPERIWGDGSDAAFTRTLDVYGLSQSLEPDLKPRILITSGTDEKDVFLQTATAFTDHLAEAAVPCTYMSFEGGHGWKYWQTVIPEAARHALGLAM